MRLSRLALFLILKDYHTPVSTGYHKKRKTSIAKHAQGTRKRKNPGAPPGRAALLR